MPGAPAVPDAADRVSGDDDDDNDDAVELDVARVDRCMD